jgi:hypothetical protein
MKRIHIYLAVTATALAITAIRPGITSAEPGELQFTNVELLKRDQVRVKPVDPSKLKITLFCSSRYQPSPNASSASPKGDFYTCTYRIPIPLGDKCRDGFDPTKVEALVQGQTVRLIYRCRSEKW